MSREQRISRKFEVQRQIAQTRQRLASTNREPTAGTFLGRYVEQRRINRRIAALQSRLDSLMAEEYRLRLEIDKSR